MIVAIVDQTNTVENIVVAVDLALAAPPGFVAVDISDGRGCDIGWNYDAASGAFTNPNPPPPEDPSAE